MTTTDVRAGDAAPLAAMWPRLLAGFVVVYGVLAVATALDTTTRFGLLTLAAVVTTVALTDRLQTGSAGAVVRSRLGLGRPGVPALLAATAVALLVLSIHPLMAALTGSTVALRPGWPWLILAVFAVHGLAEELVWRGFVFRRLREGYPFWPAVWWSMPFIVTAHLPILVTAGPVVGLGALLVAAVTSIPLSYLYEWGRRTLWAPALVHTAIDSFKIVEVPAGAAPAFALSLVAISVVAPLLVFALPRRLRPPVDASPASALPLRADSSSRTELASARRAARPAEVPPIAGSQNRNERNRHHDR